MAFSISFPCFHVFLGVFLSYATSNSNFCDFFFFHSSSELVFFQSLCGFAVLHELMFFCFGFCFIEVIASFLMHGEIFGKILFVLWQKFFGTGSSLAICFTGTFHLV